MVAVSLYRGNLHRVPDVDRRWPMPPPAIHPRDFRLLLLRRSRAISLLEPPAPPPPAESAKPPPPRVGKDDEGMGDNGCPKPGPAPEAAAASRQEGTAERCEGGGAREGEIGPLCLASTSTASGNVKGEENGGGAGDNTASNLDILSDTEKQKRDLKNKLDILNEKKHHLVQMLKQILNAEEEIKKSISVQPPLAHSSIPLQAEATTETSSVMKLAAPNMNIEVHTPRGSSTSTGAASNMLLGSVTASPSHIAPSGPQGHPTNLPTVSVSGTHFFASSPSPAASGGTSSIFRDSRLTSP